MNYQAAGSNTHLLPTRYDAELPGLGRLTTANPAGDLEAPAPGERLIAWAGWLDDEKADPALGRFEPDFKVWTAEGWNALRVGLAQVAPSLEAAGATLCLRPHAGCVLSDPQSCLNFLRDDQPPGVELLLDPVAMLTPDMLEHAEDHLARAFEAVGDQRLVVGCVLAAPRLDEGRVVHAPLADFPKLGGFIREAWAASPLAERPVLITDPRDAPA